jgi:hypothetical protein
LGIAGGGECVKDNEEIEVKHESLDRPELLQNPCHQTTSIEDRSLSTWFGKLWLSLYCYFDWLSSGRSRVVEGMQSLAMAMAMPTEQEPAMTKLPGTLSAKQVHD